MTALARALLEIGARPRVGRFYYIDDPALEVALDPVRGHASGTFLQLISPSLAAATPLANSAAPQTPTPSPVS